MTLTRPERIEEKSEEKAPRWEGRRWSVLPLPIALYAILGILVLLPMGFVLLAAFTDAPPRPGSIGEALFTLTNFGALVTPGAVSASINSLIVGIGSSVVGLLIGGFLAFITARSNVRARRFLYLVGLMPLFLPSYVGALAWAILGSPNSGLINVLARDLGLPTLVDIYNIGGLIFVLGIFYAPYAFLMIHGSFTLMSSELEEAAGVHGATPGGVLRRVTFPLALPAILGSAILIFTLTIENFPVARIIGAAGRVDTLPTYIYRLMTSSPSRGNEAAAVAIVLVLVVVAVTYAQRRLLGKRNYTTVAGKGVRAGVIDLGWFRLPALLLALVYFAVATVLPIVALLFVSIHDLPFIGTVTGAFSGGAFSLESFRELFQSDVLASATFNSIVVSILAAAIGTALAFITAYVVNRTKVPGRAGLEYVSILPLAVPSIVLGLGLLWTWLVLPVPIYGTLAVLVVTFIAAQLPQGFRGVASSILQVDRDLEDSAVMHGASRAKAVSRITLPLMRIGLTSTFLLLLMLSMRELTVALFLFTTDTRLLSIVIFDDYDNGILQRSATTSLLYCVIIFALAIAARRFGAKEQI